MIVIETFERGCSPRTRPHEPDQNRHVMMTIATSQYRNARRSCRSSTGHGAACSDRQFGPPRKTSSPINAPPLRPQRPAQPLHRRRSIAHDRRAATRTPRARHSNPHSARGTAARSPSAVSSPGGFRTPALGVRGTVNHRAGIRNPSQERRLTMSKSFPLRPWKQTSLGVACTSPAGHKLTGRYQASR